MSTTHNYRQSIVASIQIAGHQPADITTHGGNRSRGSHITATFGQQLMVSMLDLDGAMAYVQAWTADEHQWVFGNLPAQLDSAENISAGPSLTIRAQGNARTGARYESASRQAVIQAGALTWFVRDRAAADSMITAWQYVAQIAPTILAAQKELRRRTRH